MTARAMFLVRESRRPRHRRRARGPGRRAGGPPAHRRVPPRRRRETVPEAVLPAGGPEAAAGQARDVLPYQAADLGRPVPPDQPPRRDLPVQPEAAARPGAPQEALGADPLRGGGPAPGTARTGRSWATFAGTAVARSSRRRRLAPREDV